MYIKRNYSFWMTLNWSKKPLILAFSYALALNTILYLTDIYLSLPWSPIAILGIAVAFYLGFKNNSSYDRTWEGRKIWGSIVNNSRTFAAGVISFTKGADEEDIRKELIYRHIAWLTALRYQLRLSRPWEHSDMRVKDMYMPDICDAYNRNLEGDLKTYLSEDDLKLIQGKSNQATQIMRIQSERLQDLRTKQYFDDFRHIELFELIRSFYEDQGKSERIKNFPFPRQYASTALWLTLVLCVALPFGIIGIFEKPDPLLWHFWTGPLISGVITWVFFLMEKIGDYSENPFEGSYNDVPITSIAKGIEIDMREMINDSNIPEPVKDVNGFLM
jgi:putative membrane protein